MWTGRLISKVWPLMRRNPSKKKEEKIDETGDPNLAQIMLIPPRYMRQPNGINKP